MTTVLLIFGLLLLVLINVPIAVALGAVALIGMVMSKGLNSIYNAALTMFDGATNFPLLAIPLFILAGALMNTTSISRRLINLTSALIGFVRGGLAMVNVGVSMFFAEISGSAVADVAAIGSVLIPAMKKRNYTPELSAAVTSSSASIAIIIPPSIAMIIYGALSDTSIVQLFVAGIIPGVL
ncbi:MAG: TRAP transporter large permease subunit, partial [Desulfocapsaceae bacterium]|nr:TRAP transporter large permease subunit [Desulfocapsaceae bacterium]